MSAKAGLVSCGYLVLGAYFGLVLAKSEAISWFRIQEMFRFQAFHMYGLLGSGVAVGALGLALVRRSGARAWSGDAIEVPDKQRTRGLVRYWAGGTVFGMGWALLGACPGPLFTLVGHGWTIYAVGLAGALAGTWCYGAVHARLPH